MNAFFTGVIFGFVLAASIAVIIATRSKRKPRDIDLWTEEAYQAPPVVTRVLVNKRTIEL